jgi:hypothetical protein
MRILTTYVTLWIHAAMIPLRGFKAEQGVDFDVRLCSQD